jgi:hypothetical protein
MRLKCQVALIQSAPVRGGAFLHLRRSGPTLADCVALAQTCADGALADAVAALATGDRPN